MCSTNSKCIQLKIHCCCFVKERIHFLFQRKPARARKKCEKGQDPNFLPKILNGCFLMNNHFKEMNVEVIIFPSFSTAIIKMSLCKNFLLSQDQIKFWIVQIKNYKNIYRSLQRSTYTSCVRAWICTIKKRVAFYSHRTLKGSSVTCRRSVALSGYSAFLQQ